jgi:hypothetical protein
MLHPSADAITPDNAQQRVRTTIQTHISPSEWQWVVLVSSALVLLAFMPMAIFALNGTGNVQFMGVLHNFFDGGTYLSKMQLGFEGRWFVTFEHTPEAHQGGFIQVTYLLLGHLSRLTNIPTIVIFHVARLGAALLMYFALYQLGATVWTKVRARKVFFAISAIGSGFGWLLSLFTGNTDFPDLTVAEAFPFYSTVMNVHFPLALAVIAMLLTLLINAFRPGAEADTKADDSLWLAAALSFGLSLLFPQALAPLGVAVVLYALFAWGQTRKFPTRVVRWVLTIGLSALPLFAYYVFLVNYNPAMAEWNRQNVTAAPPLPGGLLIFLAGFGLPLILALPGIWRAARRFELDGDRLMLLWLVALLVLVFLPTNTQRRFSAGIMIPIAYFATRAIEDFWLQYVNRRRRTLVFTVVAATMPISLLFTLFAPVILFSTNPQGMSGPMLERDYIGAFDWLRASTSSEAVILASDEVGIWIPGYTGDRVVYAHPFETLDATTKQADLIAFYTTATGEECSVILQRYDVRYILFGPQERELSPTPVCLNDREPVVEIGQVAIYAP